MVNQSLTTACRVPVGRLAAAVNARSRSPAAEVAGDQVSDHTTDITALFCGLAGACMIARNGCRPTSFAAPKRLQKLSGINDVLFGIHHLGWRIEIGPMIVIVHLHAAKVDQFFALALGFVELIQRISLRISDDGSPLNIQRVRVEAALHPGLSQTYSIENAERNTFSLGNSREKTFANLCIRSVYGMGRFRDKSRQRDPAEKATRYQPFFARIWKPHSL